MTYPVYELIIILKTSFVIDHLLSLSVLLSSAPSIPICGKKKEFEDTKGVIRTRKSMKNRQHNDQKKKDKKPNNDLQNIHIKPKIE